MRNIYFVSIWHIGWSLDGISHIVDFHVLCMILDFSISNSTICPESSKMGLELLIFLKDNDHMIFMNIHSGPF